jgi:hypothetical protein
MVAGPPPRTERTGRARGERGAATLLVLPAALALCAVLLGATARLGAAATVRARADAVADLVALAAVTGDRVGAEEVATANGGRLLELREDGPDRTASVDVGGVRGSATAAPAGPGGG